MFFRLKVVVRVRPWRKVFSPVLHIHMGQGWRFSHCSTSNSNLNNRYLSSFTSTVRAVNHAGSASRTFRASRAHPSLSPAAAQYTVFRNNAINSMLACSHLIRGRPARIQPSSMPGQCRHIRCQDLWTSGVRRGWRLTLRRPSFPL